MFPPNKPFDIFPPDSAEGFDAFTFFFIPPSILLTCYNMTINISLQTNYSINSGRGQREAHINWSMEMQRKP